MNRTKNVIRNIRWGIMQRAVGIVLPFIVRTILIYSLGASYAGLNGLFSSVLSVLSLAELGVSNAITYSMYKPISEGDTDHICALLNVYRRAYRIIGTVILSMGLALLPFLRYLIHGSTPDAINIYLLFCIYLLNGNIDEEEYKGLKKRVAGLLIWKLGGATRNTLDSIAVSMYLGLVTVAVYNNYWLIINVVSSALSIISSSMLASVGNKIATDTPQANYRDFHKFHFIYMWLAGWCTVCMICLYQPFMRQWMGEDLMFSNGIMLLFCYLFFMLKQGDINSVYYQAAGLWWEGRWRSVIEAVSNLSLNFLLGKFFGVTGILMATIISYNIAYLYGSKFTFTCYFKNDRLKVFYLDNLVYLVITGVSGFITYKLIDLLLAPLTSGIIKNFIAIIVCIVVPNLIFAIVYSANKQTRRYINYGISAVARMMERS